MRSCSVCWVSVPLVPPRRWVAVGAARDLDGVQELRLGHAFVQDQHLDALDAPQKEEEALRDGAELLEQLDDIVAAVARLGDLRVARRARRSKIFITVLTRCTRRL